MAKTTAKLVSPAISCDHCVQAITGGLKGTPGIESVSVDKDSKEVTVTYDTDYLTEKNIRDKMKDIGYEVVG
ncbi:MAG: cation transporter [Firmicutes bacterium]|nr:cation transporter [Bacillota bacterium]